MVNLFYSQPGSVSHISSWNLHNFLSYFQATAEKAKKEADDKLWEDDDKNAAKKKQKKEEEERKKQELLAKKEENKKLLESEMNDIVTTKKIPMAKATRAQIQQEVERRNKNIEMINKANKPGVPVTVVKTQEEDLVENLNRVVLDSTVASTVDEAIAVLGEGRAEEDRHPEKRMKAAFKAYEENNLSRIKSENPGLKLSQMKQIIFKEWQKSPENPLNKT